MLIVVCSQSTKIVYCGTDEIKVSRKIKKNKLNKLFIMFESHTVYVNTRLSKSDFSTATFPIRLQQITAWDSLNFNRNHYLYYFECKSYI
jgi:hypothetical protein